MTKDIELIVKEINDLLSKNPLLSPALNLTKYQINNWTDKDWEDYTKETGNERVIIEDNKDPIISLIDKSTGFDKVKDLAILKFLLWTIKEFKKGLEI